MTIAYSQYTVYLIEIRYYSGAEWAVYKDLKLAMGGYGTYTIG